MFDTEDPTVPEDNPGPETTLDDEDLVSTLCEQAGHVAIGECRLVLLVAELDRRRLWADAGIQSCAHWLNWRCGTTLGAAREQVRVGRALARLPLVRAAFASGSLSYSKVRAITRVATPELEPTLVEWALQATAAQLERIVREYRRADPAEGREALGRHCRRYVRTWTDDDGMLVIRARLSPEDGAVVLAALDAAQRALAADEDGSPSTPTPIEDVSAETSGILDPAEPGRADALVDVCRTALDRQGTALDRQDGRSPVPEAVTVLVHVDEPVLADAANPGCAFVEGVGAVSAHTVERLACESTVSRLRYRADDAVEPIGTTRAVPPAMRRALLARDRGCRWPGCTRRRFLHAHHVVWWSRGGKTVLSNLVTVCTAHHRLVHEGGWSMQLAPNGALRVSSPDGTELAGHPALGPPEGPDLASRHRQAGLDVGPDTLAHGGERFDLGCAVDALLCLSGAMWEDLPDRDHKRR